jgi:hypothetical protein
MTARLLANREEFVQVNYTMIIGVNGLTQVVPAPVDEARVRKLPLRESEAPAMSLGVLHWGIPDPHRAT